jgi:hypothetical protein
MEHCRECNIIQIVNYFYNLYNYIHWIYFAFGNGSHGLAVTLSLCHYPVIPLEIGNLGKAPCFYLRSFSLAGCSAASF